MQLISQLTEYFYFDHHFFLLDSAVDANQFISTDAHTPQTVYVWKGDDDVIAVDHKTKDFFMIVACNKTTGIEHTINLLKVVKEIQSVQKQMKVGIFLTQTTSVRDLLTLFQWCTDNQITDTFAASHSTHQSGQCTFPECLLNIFTFHAPVLELINVSSADKFDVYFQSTQANFRQREVRFGAPIKDNADGKVWFTVLKLMNGSLAVQNQNDQTVNEAFENGIDVLRFLYVPQNHTNLNVYPVKFKGYTIVVPASLPYAEFSAYLKNGVTGDFSIYSIIIYQQLH